MQTRAFRRDGHKAVVLESRLMPDELKIRNATVRLYTVQWRFLVVAEKPQEPGKDIRILSSGAVQTTYGSDALVFHSGCHASAYMPLGFVVFQHFLDLEIKRHVYILETF